MLKYLCTLSLVLGLGSFAALGQGSLTPPGAPSPTMKTLDEMEPRTAITALPYTITNSGSYYFASNLTYTGAGHGITVSASEVTIDLNGFALVGNGGGSISNGIYVPATAFNLVVRNGSIRGWKQGILALNANVGHFVDLRLSNCSSNGLSTGNSALVEHCSASSLSGIGFAVGNLSIVRDCTASTTTAGGFYLNPGSTAVNCSVSASPGIGIITLTGCTIRDCTIFNNNGIAISTAGYCSIVGCTVANNFNTGIMTGYSKVEHCTVSGNSGDGIQASLSSQIVNNLLYNNGAGLSNCIHITGSGSRVEGNHVLSSLRGIKVDAANNVIIGNSATGNTANYSVVAGNVFGPLVTTNTVATNTHPHANFDF